MYIENQKINIQPTKVHYVLPKPPLLKQEPFEKLMKTISYGISYDGHLSDQHLGMVTRVTGWACQIFAMISLQDCRCSQGNLHTHSLKPTSIQNQPTLRHSNLRSYQGIPFKTYPYHQTLFTWRGICLVFSVLENSRTSDKQQMGLYFADEKSCDMKMEIEHHR